MTPRNLAQRENGSSFANSVDTPDNSVDTAELLLLNAFKYHGLHRSIISDRDPKRTAQCGWNYATYFSLITNSLPPFTIKRMDLPNATTRLWKLHSEAPPLNVETGLISYRMWKWQMNSASIPASHLSQFYLKHVFHPTTEAGVYSHLSPRQTHLRLLSRHSPRLAFSVPYSPVRLFQRI